MQREAAPCIVILTPGFPENEHDTTCLPLIQQFVQSFIKLYSPESIIIITFQYPYTKQDYYWNEVRVIGLGGKNKSKLSRLITWVKAYYQLRKIYKTSNLIGILSIFHTECALLGSIFAKRNKLNHISWLQGQDVKLENKYANRIKATPNELAALSPFLQEEFEKNYGIKPQYIIENGVTENLFPDMNSGERAIDVLGVGSLIPIKNYSLFIQIISELKKNYPNIKTAIAGNGVEFNKLQHLINELGLHENITLLGLVSHSKILKLMSESKTVLHTSNYEGSCSVLFEALYSGCFVASTCNPSFLNYNEFYFSTNKEELISKLQYYLNTNDLKPRRVVYNLIDDSAKKIMALYQ